ncbi:MAG: twin-arginine translocase TatA/TatE family subunit [Halobacteriaceae archaeon]
MPLLPLFSPVGGLGSPELIIILLIAILLFGANKIPKLARSTGQAIGEFRRGREEIEEELEEVRETASVESGVAGGEGGAGGSPADASGGSSEGASESSSEGTEAETETESADDENQ